MKTSQQSLPTIGEIGHKDVSDLIRLAISSLDAATWLDDEVLESDHLPRWTQPQRLSAEQAAKMRAGYDAKRSRDQALREARLDYSQGA